MITLYALIKFVHILFAMIAVGFNASCAIWITRASREPQHLNHVLRGIKPLDDRFAKPAYALLLITGWAMVWVSGLPLTTFWIAAALVLWLITVVIGLGFYVPTLRRQVAALETDGPQSEVFQRLSRRATSIGIITLLPVLMILFLMVVKPIV